MNFLRRRPSVSPTTRSLPDHVDPNLADLATAAQSVFPPGHPTRELLRTQWRATLAHEASADLEYASLTLSAGDLCVALALESPTIVDTLRAMIALETTVVTADEWPDTGFGLSLSSQSWHYRVPVYGARLVTPTATETMR